MYNTLILYVMFKKNTNYLRTDFSHDLTAEGSRELVLYPENKLPDITVVSEFGDCLVVTSDVYDLFNQQRISNLGADVARDFIARNYPVSSPVSDAISKMSDDEIMTSIKPRNIQSYSELMEWSKYLNAQIENGLSVNEPSNEPLNEPSNEPTNEPTSD